MLNVNPLEIFLLDTRGAPHTTGVATSGGGTVESSIDLSGAVIGEVVGLEVIAGGDTVDTDIEFFTDAGMLDRIYYATAKDCYTAPYRDMTSWALFSFDSEMVDRVLYYRFTNNGANNTTYDVKLFAVVRADRWAAPPPP